MVAATAILHIKCHLISMRPNENQTIFRKDQYGGNVGAGILKKCFRYFLFNFQYFFGIFLRKNRYFSSKNVFQNSGSHIPSELVFFNPALIFIEIEEHLICKMAVAVMIVIF